MTDPTISQDARKAAVEFARDYLNWSGYYREQVLQGNLDRAPLVQAFARFEAHLRTPASGEAGEMVERLRALLQFDRWDDARLAHWLRGNGADLITRLSATDTEAMRIVQKHYAHIASLDREAMTEVEREQTRGAWNAISAVKHEIDALAKGGAE